MMRAHSAEGSGQKIQVQHQGGDRQGWNRPYSFQFHHRPLCFWKQRVWSRLQRTANHGWSPGVPSCPLAQPLLFIPGLAFSHRTANGEEASSLTHLPVKFIKESASLSWRASFLPNLLKASNQIAVLCLITGLTQYTGLLHLHILDISLSILVDNLQF